MFSRALWSGTLSLLLAASATPVGSGPRKDSKAAITAARQAESSREGWPNTPAGELARRWVAAFSAGEGAMRTFLERNLTRQSLAARGMDARIESYRKLRERYGSLVLASVTKETPGELTARLMAADATTHTFVFTVQSKPPHQLVSVGNVQTSHRGGMGFHH